MSIWVRAVCKKSLSSVTPELLAEAIGTRLATIAAVYCPDGEEPPRQILANLRIEPEDAHPFGIWRMHYTESSSRYLRVERLVGREFEQERRELFDQLASQEGEASDRVRALLSEARECVGIALSPSDTSGMAWPLAIAAAASLARAGDGMIRVDGEGWLEPKGKEVAMVLGEKG